ncbi:Peptidyl-prolyl cis-trans isomerase 1 [Toxocara canis]|uniref:peptidylprolyl isomerase n=1 Tax=Toxocara canis TaxID=6265 RepID=A0A0B2VS81_TOXCA|nr:Peptidyl-prolyl cis-trans isomerase 1 [Toxocara canis]
MSKKERRRAFFDVTIDGRLAGRIVMELFNDVAPRTAHNFLMLCTGMAGVGKVSGKPLHYKASTFHRIIKNFMIQGGDFTKGDGTGGESVYGGMFDDEDFVMKHSEPFMLSMANKGPNTNGSQFFITTAPAPHLDGVHVVFGKVVSGQEVVTEIEHLKTNAKNRPLADVVILNCGELVRKKKRRHSSSESKSTSLSESSSSTSTSSDEKSKKKRHKKKRKTKKEKVSEEVEQLEIGATVTQITEAQLSSVKAEEVPRDPEHHNQYLMRRSHTPEEKRKEKEKERKKRNESPSRSKRGLESRRAIRRMRVTRSGHKIKGRGALRFRTPEGSDRERSRTPPHWRREQNRVISLDELHRRRELKESGQGDEQQEQDKKEEERGKEKRRRESDRERETKREGRVKTREHDHRARERSRRHSERENGAEKERHEKPSRLGDRITHPNDEGRRRHERSDARRDERDAGHKSADHEEKERAERKAPVEKEVFNELDIGGLETEQQKDEKTKSAKEFPGVELKEDEGDGLRLEDSGDEVMLDEGQEEEKVVPSEANTENEKRDDRETQNKHSGREEHRHSKTPQEDKRSRQHSTSPPREESAPPEEKQSKRAVRQKSPEMNEENSEDRKGSSEGLDSEELKRRKEKNLVHGAVTIVVEAVMWTGERCTMNRERRRSRRSSSSSSSGSDRRSHSSDAVVLELVQQAHHLLHPVHPQSPRMTPQEVTNLKQEGSSSFEHVRRISRDYSSYRHAAAISVRYGK